MLKKFLSIFILGFGVYGALFLICFYVHNNESRIIANRANDLIGKLSSDNLSGLLKVVTIQKMKRIPRPLFFEPKTLINSLIGERGVYVETINLLGKKIESLKAELNGSFLQEINLEKSDLSEASLQGANLSRANLRKANLRGANLKSINLDKANLEGADLGSVDLIESKLIEGNLQGVNLSEAQLNRGDFSNSSFQGANLARAKLRKTILLETNFRDANFRNADLYDAHLTKSNLERADLSDANLILAKLDSTNLRSANLSDTNLYGVDFKDAILEGANLSGAINVSCKQIASAVINEKTRLPDYIVWESSVDSIPKCNISILNKGFDLIRAHLKEASLYQADLQNANLSHADLKGALLSSATLIDADLTGANLKGAKLELTNLSNTILADADLRGANLYRALGVDCEQIKSAKIDKTTRMPDYILLTESVDSGFSCKNAMRGQGGEFSRAKLADSFLYQADLQNANLSHADLKGALLSSATLIDADLTGANLKGAKLELTNLSNTILADADLRGANLYRALGVDCEQIKSAKIDKTTRMPDYILLTESVDSGFSCKNVMRGQGGEFSRAKLADSFLYQADLQNANLSHADLSGAQLGLSLFMGADLTGANLKGAKLELTNLSNTILAGADLRGANLNRALGVDCEQIKSAEIDKTTRMPDYITLSESSGLSYECNFVKK